MRGAPAKGALSLMGACCGGGAVGPALVGARLLERGTPSKIGSQGRHLRKARAVAALGCALRLWARRRPFLLPRG